VVIGTGQCSVVMLCSAGAGGEWGWGQFSSSMSDRKSTVGIYINNLNMLCFVQTFLKRFVVLMEWKIGTFLGAVAFRNFFIYAFKTMTCNTPEEFFFSNKIEARVSRINSR
jgi:hypothetical protein